MLSLDKKIKKNYRYKLEVADCSKCFGTTDLVFVHSSYYTVVANVGTSSFINFINWIQKQKQER